MLNYNVVESQLKKIRYRDLEPGQFFEFCYLPGLVNLRIVGGHVSMGTFIALTKDDVGIESVTVLLPTIDTLEFTRDGLR